MVCVLKTRQNGRTPETNPILPQSIMTKRFDALELIDRDKMTGMLTLNG